jgi:hypothetical protein
MLPPPRSAYKALRSLFPCSRSVSKKRLETVPQPLPPEQNMPSSGGVRQGGKLEGPAGDASGGFSLSRMIEKPAGPLPQIENFPLSQSPKISGFPKGIDLRLGIRRRQPIGPRRPACAVSVTLFRTIFFEQGPFPTKFRVTLAPLPEFRCEILHSQPCDFWSLVRQRLDRQLCPFTAMRWRAKSATFA